MKKRQGWRSIGTGGGGSHPRDTGTGLVEYRKSRLRSVRAGFGSRQNRIQRGFRPVRVGPGRIVQGKKQIIRLPAERDPRAARHDKIRYK